MGLKTSTGQGSEGGREEGLPERTGPAEDGRGVKGLQSGQDDYRAELCRVSKDN